MSVWSEEKVVRIELLKLGDEYPSIYYFNRQASYQIVLF